jgi:tRNA A-37 threonylcarbamoyl transferase component Bud32
MSFISKQKITGLRLANNWQGLAVEKWSNFAFKSGQLLESPNLIFKSDANSITILKQVENKGEKILFVVKKNTSYDRLKNLGDLLRPPKAVRNFHTALELKDKKIDVAEPVAALWRKKGIQCLENIYITEFCQGSLSLYDVARGKGAEIISRFSVRKVVIQRIAELVAKLHKSGYWHRDSKAGNFIVYKSEDGAYKAKLVDLDGIKRNIFGLQKNHIRTLSKLAETLTLFKAVNFTDLYRGFLYYCDAMGKSSDEAGKLFRKVERAAVAARLLTIVSDSYELKKK